MKYFLDTEFSERGSKFPVQLISIGIVAEDGREFYAHSADYDAAGCNDWVKANVLPHVQAEPPMSLWSIAESVKLFVGDDKPEFWGYYADYDWVVFCQMFGTMLDLPEGWPMYCRDLKQRADEMYLRIPQQTEGEHNALNDARWNKFAYELLMRNANTNAAKAWLD